MTDSDDGAKDWRPRGTPPARLTDRNEDGVPEARLAAMEGRPVTGVDGVRGLPNIV